MTVPLLSCRLISHSLSPHIQQLYTGFSILHQRGLVEIRQITKRQRIVYPAKPMHLRNARHAHLRVILNGNFRIHYDTHDSWEVDEEFLNQSDIYFKRSYSPARLMGNSATRGKVFALGLNYLVCPDGFDQFALRRAVTLGSVPEKLREFSRLVRFFDHVRFTPRLCKMEMLPDPGTQPRVLFMAGAWDPEISQAHLPEKTEERHQINETRAECIRLLRDALGRSFTGGFIRNEFSEERYPDLVLPVGVKSSKREYIQRVREHQICVATTGLHGSIGWKLAEYVALSRAIVSERLHYEVPNGFSEGKHYLVFNSPGECVAKVKSLLENPNKRLTMMIENAQYYQSFLRPDALVLNTLFRALLQRCV
jgi:hypothetical protein